MQFLSFKIYDGNDLCLYTWKKFFKLVILYVYVCIKIMVDFCYCILYYLEQLNFIVFIQKIDIFIYLIFYLGIFIFYIQNLYISFKGFKIYFICRQC